MAEYYLFPYTFNTTTREDDQGIIFKFAVEAELYQTKVTHNQMVQILIALMNDAQKAQYPRDVVTTWNMDSIITYMCDQCDVMFDKIAIIKQKHCEVVSIVGEALHSTMHDAESSDVACSAFNNTLVELAVSTFDFPKRSAGQPKSPQQD